MALGLFSLQPLLAFEPLTRDVVAMSQQQYQVTGIVTDEQGEPIIGANIVEKGSTNGTVTDLDGRFTLAIHNPQTLLVVSYIGYNAQEISATAGSSLQIKLKEDSQSLDEVVVVGYQTLRKTDVVGAVSSIKAKELNVTAPTVGQSLVGKVSGVQIAQVSGAPYNSTKIRVRGVASINASSDPLYVIDGYPSNADLMLNPEDIESIERCRLGCHLWFTCCRWCSPHYHQTRQRG